MSIEVPLRLMPQPVEKVWGGHRLANLVRDLPEGKAPIGEAWIVSDREERATSVVGGPFDGRSLRGLMLSERDALLGEAATNSEGGFPLLVKYLEAAQDLSVQVHPDRSAAARLQSESKEECWYILDAEPEAVVYLGLADGVDARAFAERAPTSDCVSLLKQHVVRAGDFVHVPAGTVHAIGAGIALVEVQESSDTTYRIYDWGRVGLDGKPRATHIDEALTATDFDAHPPAPVRPTLEGIAGAGDTVDRRASLGDFEPFSVELLEVNRGTRVDDPGLPVVLVLLSGSGVLAWGAGAGEAQVQAGETWLLPADLHNVRIGGASGDLTLLRAVPARSGS